MRIAPLVLLVVAVTTAHAGRGTRQVHAPPLQQRVAAVDPFVAWAVAHAARSARGEAAAQEEVGLQLACERSARLEAALRAGNAAAVYEAAALLLRCPTGGCLPWWMWT